MLLAEELLLCAIPPDGVVVSPKVVAGIGGAIAAELVLGGRIALEEEGVQLVDRTPTGDEILDDVLKGLEDPDVTETRATWFVSGAGQVASPKLHARIVADGLVVKHKGDARRFWVDKPDWYEITPAGEEPRRRLTALLLGQREPDARDALLASLTAACDLVKLHVPKEARKEAKARAEAFGQGEGVPEHVRDAIRGAQAATASATLGAQSSIHNS
jgi:hypothetical protein